MIHESFTPAFSFACRFCGVEGPQRSTRIQAASDYSAHLHACTKNPTNTRGATR